MSNKLICKSIILILILFSEISFSQTNNKQDWTHYARLSGHGIGPKNITSTVEKAQEQGTLGIEFDNDITGRYDSFLDPGQKLNDIKKAAEAAHKIGNYAFIYMAGTECITGNADRSAHSIFKDHPDWVQRNIDGKPAVFSGGVAFWVSKGDEDVWISPYAKEWRKRYMEIVRQIAATGIDGIYIDVAYWMCSFEGWENSWASYDDYTVAAFKEKTGVDARKDFTPGDFNNPNFLKWVDFRIQTMTDFFKEVYENVKSVNPNCLVIPEISPSVDGDAVKCGADSYELQKYSDVITHEFFINTNTGAKRNTFDWLTYVSGVNTLRAYDESHATWLLSYSWDHEKNTNPEDAMKLLSCAQVMAGGNFWDAPGHSMAGSNDYSLRKEIFGWIKGNENLLYQQKKSINPVGVYFSPSTRNYFMDDYVKSYYGILHLLLNNHLEYQILTPRTLKDFSGSVLILPDTKIISENETDIVKQLYKRGVSLILTGETGYYDSDRKTKKENDILNFLGDNKNENRKYLYLPECPGKKYFDTHDTSLITGFYKQISKILPNLNTGYKITASFNVSTQPADLGDKDCIYITNLKGLKGFSSCIPVAEDRIKVEFEAPNVHDIYFIPYLGKKQKITAQIKSDAMDKSKNIISFTLPPVQFGGIVVVDK
ncbi:MAG: hypothetical protein P4L45_17245 [Ignavibacteriaceae bacterium]|nr:hypothetical protein [Ignavibacteriaceae bacterium]